MTNEQVSARPAGGAHREPGRPGDAERAPRLRPRPSTPRRTGADREGPAATPGRPARHALGRICTSTTLGALVLSGCGLLGGGDVETAAPTTADADFGSACTGQGRLTLRPSIQVSDPETARPGGDILQIGLAGHRVEDDTALASLLVQGASEGAQDLRDLELDARASYGSWTLTVRSICAADVRIDVDLTE